MVLDSKKTCARPVPSISWDQGIDLPPVTSRVTPMIWADASDTRYSVADTASGVPSARVGRSPLPVVSRPLASDTPYARQAPRPE